MLDWNDKTKRFLKAELIKRGISNAELAERLTEIGIEETKSSIDSKISRGTFSASFLIQCLYVIGCSKLDLDLFENRLSIAAEPSAKYHKNK